MANNGLWKDDRYLACGWLEEGHLDEEEFAQQVDVAMGTLWYTKEAVRRGRVDVLWIRTEIQAQREEPSQMANSSMTLRSTRPSTTS
jgi:hypothetical protein